MLVGHMHVMIQLVIHLRLEAKPDAAQQRIGVSIIVRDDPVPGNPDYPRRPKLIGHRHGDETGNGQFVIASRFLFPEFVKGDVGSGTDPEGQPILEKRPDEPQLGDQPIPVYGPWISLIEPSDGPVEIASEISPVLQHPGSRIF